MKQLTRVGITTDLKERADMELYYLKSTGEFDVAVQEWEAKQAATRTWQNIKSLQNMQRKTRKANSQQSNWEQMQSRSKPTLQGDSLRT